MKPARRSMVVEKSREDRVCSAASQEHSDAQAIVEYLLDRNGHAEDTQGSIARQLGMLRDAGRGIYQVDTGRFHRARNHIRDRVDENGRPCCGYTLHYRRSGPMSDLALVDPGGDLGEHAKAAIATVLGMVSRERQHHTENQRMIETVELLGDHALANEDRQGYRLCQRTSIEIERDGTISPPTMSALELWCAGMAS